MADKKKEKHFCDLLSGELGPDNQRQCGGAGPHYILAFVAKGSWAL